MRYLEGKDITPTTNKDAKDMIGARVKFLRDCDIDRSGRGYFFPRTGTVEGSEGRNIIINGDFISLSEIKEMVLHEQTNN